MSATHAMHGGCRGAGEGFAALGKMFGALGMAMAAGRRHHGGPWGFRGGPWWGGPGFLFGPPFRRGPRARRGDVRAAILTLLAEEPRNGYQIIQEIGERSGGEWRPSPGSVYPALQQLEDEGLVRAEESEGRRVYRLTDQGRAYVSAHEDELRAPWEATGEEARGDLHELRVIGGQVAAALVQVAQVGSEAQIAAAREVLVEARKALYRILADGEEPTDQA